MKLVIAGSRDLEVSIEELDQYIKKYFANDEITEIVSGSAKGIDTSGINYAKKFGIKVTEFIPNWNLYGRSAGIRRNKDMAIYADKAIVIYNGSRGSQNMIDNMKEIGKPCIVIKKNMGIQKFL